jgi:hypothetical protein
LRLGNHIQGTSTWFILSFLVEKEEWIGNFFILIFWHSRVYDPKSKGADWELIKLDRKVEGHPLVKLSENPIYPNQPVYILGHPCGLSLKYASGAQVRNINGTCFAADLNVYCGIRIRRFSIVKRMK